MKTTDRVMTKIAFPIFIAAAILLTFSFVVSSKSTTTQNNAYIRVINCIISIPATTRTRADIEGCYQKVEHDLHVKIPRYNERSN